MSARLTTTRCIAARIPTADAVVAQGTTLIASSGDNGDQDREIVRLSSRSLLAAGADPDSSLRCVHIGYRSELPIPLTTGLSLLYRPQKTPRTIIPGFAAPVVSLQEYVNRIVRVHSRPLVS